MLARTLGGKWRGLFAEYAAARTPSEEGSYAIDGARFAEFLDARGMLPDSGKLELLAHRIARKRHGAWIVPLSESGEVALALRIGRFRLVRVVSVGIGGRTGTEGTTGSVV